MPEILVAAPWSLIFIAPWIHIIFFYSKNQKGK